MNHHLQPLIWIPWSKMKEHTCSWRYIYTETMAFQLCNFCNICSQQKTRENAFFFSFTVSHGLACFKKMCRVNEKCRQMTGIKYISFQESLILVDKDLSYEHLLHFVVVLMKMILQDGLKCVVRFESSLLSISKCPKDLDIHEN